MPRQKNDRNARSIEVSNVIFIFKILTKDSVTVVVDAVIYARVHDATMSVVNIEDARASTHLLGATTLRTILGTVGLSELLSDRDRIDKVMQVRGLEVCIITVCIIDGL